MSEEHTPAARRIAEIIIPQGINRRGVRNRIRTAYGDKTRDGIADLIDRETGLPELLEALQLYLDDAVLRLSPDSTPGFLTRLAKARAAIAKVKGKK